MKPILEVAPIQVTWTLREPPWIPEAVAACAAVARELAKRALLRPEEALSSLRAVVSQEAAGTDNNQWLVLIGPAELLPWADGAVYLAQEPGTPLYLPTLYAPSVPVQLLDRAFRKRYPHIGAPYAILPETKSVISLVRSSKLEAEALRNWLEGKNDATA